MCVYLKFSVISLKKKGKRYTRIHIKLIPQKYTDILSKIVKEGFKGKRGLKISVV